MKRPRSPTADHQFETSVLSDAQMAAQMRLVLAVAAMMAAFVDAGFGRQPGQPAWIAFAGYLVYSATVCALLRWAPTALRGRLAHWLDVAWFTMIIALAGGAQNLYFLFYFFAILCAAFRWGYEEGARVTVVSVASFAACSLLASRHGDPSQLLMRITFLLALGHMIVYWGGSKLAFQRRLALLREVCRLSNPRFGAAATLDRLLHRTLDFYRAQHVLLLMRDTASGGWTLRSLAASAQGRAHGMRVEQLDDAAAARWSVLCPAQATLVNRLAWLGWRRPGIRYDAAQGRWKRCDGDAARHCTALADMLEASSLISAPLPAQCERGFIIVCAQDSHFRKSDALFLEHLAGQVMPMVQNIDALDRLASEAASNERLRLALDLHDTAIQPYIGLKLGLGALCRKASPDNPLRSDIEGLAKMCEQVLADLRSYARAVKQPAAEPAAAPRSIAPQLRAQAAQLRRQWGAAIDIDVDEGLRVGNRLGAAVLQVVREGVNNIGKHVRTPTGRVRVRRVGERIQIHIENPSGDVPQAAFQPVSITERARALGGSAAVQLGEPGKTTAVLVQIPV